MTTILLDITRTLARQGLAFRGDMNEENGNFNQLFLLISRHNAIMKRWLDDKKCRKHNVTYLNHDSQNEFIDLLADETKNTIIEEIKKSDFFSLMDDTTPDVSHQHQLSICLRYLDPFEEVCERLLAVCEAVDKTGLGIDEKIKEIIQKKWSIM